MDRESPNEHIIRREIKKPPPPPPEALKPREVREDERAEKQFLLDVVAHLGLSPRSALEVLARYDTRAMNQDLKGAASELSSQYGLSFNEFTDTEQKQIMMLYFSVDKTRSDESQKEFVATLDQLMHRGLVNRALGKLDQLRERLTTLREVQEVRTTLRELLSSMSRLAKQIPPERPENEDYWSALYARFQGIVGAKREMGDEVQRVYSELFDEFSDFIEDEFAARAMQRLVKQGRKVSVEHFMQDFYGRTPDEVEAIKQRNRKQVAQEIIKAKDEPYVDIATIERLHEVNNRGIVPRSESRLREKDIIFFGGVRMGILPGDVRQEMEAFAERVNRLIDEDVLKGVSKRRFEVAVAKLHNDLLNIHPFDDRNGSTALLFLELMMAKKGYVPSPTREKDYYQHLRKALDNNPIAIGLVGYEQYRITHIPGYFEGKTTIGQKDVYKRVLEIFLEWKKKQEKKAA